MLVRILSNIASFLGNARNRAVLVSCLVLAISTSSVVGILAMNENRAKNAATAENANSRQQEDTIWLSEDQVDSKNTLQEDPTSETKAAPQQEKSSSNASAADPDQSELAVKLNTSSVTLSANQLSAEITAGVAGDSAESSWNLTLSSKNPEITIASSQTVDKIFSFRLQASSDITPGEYLVTVEAVNSEGKKLSTQLTVTVTEVEPDAL